VRVLRYIDVPSYDPLIYALRDPETCTLRIDSFGQWVLWVNAVSSTGGTSFVAVEVVPRERSSVTSTWPSGARVGLYELNPGTWELWPACALAQCDAELVRVSDAPLVPPWRRVPVP
jgi:hypothetical protein